MDDFTVGLTKAKDGTFGWNVQAKVWGQAALGRPSGVAPEASGERGEHDLAAAMMAAARAVRNSIDRQAGNKPPQDMTTRDLVLELLAFRYAEEFADSEQYEARARVGARRLMRRAFEGIDADRLRECESVDRIIAYLVEYVTEPERQKVADLVPERMAEERSERARRG